MLGRYEKFPETVHSVAVLQHQNPPKSIQQAILLTFHRLNSETFDLGAVTPYLKQNCDVSFEFGVAEGLAFNFLDKDELNQCLGLVVKEEMETLDFFFVVRYHLIKKGGKRVPLRFDYHLLRLVFHDNRLEIHIRHEKGTRHVSLDELTDFMIKQINIELSCRQLTPLVLSEFVKVNVE